MVHCTKCGAMNAECCNCFGFKPKLDIPDDVLVRIKETFNDNEIDEHLITEGFDRLHICASFLENTLGYESKMHPAIEWAGLGEEVTDIVDRVNALYQKMGKKVDGLE